MKESTKNIEKFIDAMLEKKKPNTLYEAARHIIMAGGKRLRPYLVLKSCEIVGGNKEVVIPFAAALEILHNFTLIHDDVMDKDALRRGVQTVHARWSTPIAIASGDLLFSKVYQSMINPWIKGIVRCETTLKCIEKVTHATISLCEGQIMDISFPDITKVSEEDYISMVGDKTASLFKACAEIGGLVGEGTPHQIKSLGSYAWNAGITFQIVDDILGILSDEKDLGKPIGSDIREGKKTLIIIHALKTASKSERKLIKRVLGESETPIVDLKKVKKTLKKTGSIDYARKKAKKYSDAAKNILITFPDSEPKKDLIELVDYFLNRAF